MAIRDIIFRGKRIDNGEWVEGGYRHEKVGEYLTAVFVIEPLTDGVWEHHRVDPATVGQYTGLTDKNGKRIFEGDIVKDASIDMLGDVVFSITGVPSFAINDVCDGLQYHDGFWHDLEVIGTIHDNPELLKEENT